MRKFVVPLLLTAALGCADDATQEPIVPLVGPGPASTVASAPPGTLPAPPETCPDVACCEAKLGVKAGTCVDISVIAGHCFTSPLDGAACELPSLCGGSALCSDGACVPAPDAEDCTAFEVGPCQTAACDIEAKKCFAKSAADGTPCSDGDVCNGDELCQLGACAGGGAPTCDDGNVCTSDSCNPKIGCVYDPKPGKPCDDGNICSQADQCSATGTCTGGETICACTTDASCAGKGDLCTGAYVCKDSGCAPAGGGPKDCDDKNPCTVDTCNGATGECGHAPASGACEDGDLCTTGDTCQSGACVGTKAACDDGNACTKGDHCDAKTGLCAVDSNACACSADADCPPIPACDGLLVCVNGGCVTQPGSKVDCGNIVALPCHAISCDPATKSCLQTEVPDGTACDDGNECTLEDSCAGGNCLPKSAIGSCDDQNPCTADHCEPANGCVHDKLSGDACDDNNACSIGDVCLDGDCGATAPLGCDDQNECTTDGCDPESGCTTANADGACDDGDECTAIDACSAGKCAGKGNACGCTTDADCPDDGDLCDGSPVCQGSKCVTDPATIVVCPDPDPALGKCLAAICAPATGLCGIGNAPNGAACDDASACTTGDVCQAGGCQGAPKDCDDGNVCTADACDPSKGCTSTAAPGACDDGNACTTDETCVGTTCKDGKPVNCDDGNLCTADTCSAKKGCKYGPAIGTCNDGSLCTTGDACIEGKCKGTTKTCAAADTCSAAGCDATTGACVQEPLDCSDGNACTEDGCDLNAGCTHADKACDDLNACTTDACDALLGCTFTAEGCDDDDPCTVDACAPDGSCISEVTNCDDDDPCTTDTCGDAGCASTAMACDDGDPCTVDACSLGACVSLALDCADTDPCTTDACAGGQCVNAAKTCNDGDACTADACGDGGACSNVLKDCADAVDCTTDACSAGECIHTTVDASCGDGNDCTDDVCSATTGCSNPNNTLPCSDDDACTMGDTCGGGACLPGALSCGPCVDVNEGGACDDEDPDTVGDICLEDVCKGFTKIVAVPAGATTNPWLDRLTYTGDGFYATGGDDKSGGRGYLVKVSADGMYAVSGTEKTGTTYASVTHELAATRGGDLVAWLGGKWDASPKLQQAYDKLPGKNSLSAAWGTAAGATSYYYFTGRHSGSSWVAQCNVATQACASIAVGFSDFVGKEVPRALGGWTTATSGGTAGTQVMMLADFVNTQFPPTYFNDVYAYEGPSGASWAISFYDTGPSQNVSRDVAGTDAVNAWIGGSYGLIRTRALVNGKAEWQNLIQPLDDQEDLDFDGVHVSKTVVLYAATRYNNGSDSTTLTLVTHDVSGSSTNASTWAEVPLAKIDACAGLGCPSTPFNSGAAGVLEDVWYENGTVVLVGWGYVAADAQIEAIAFVR